MNDRKLGDATAGLRAPATFDQFATVLQDRMASLSPSHRKVADRVLSDPEGCAFMTISELAQAVGVNESTIVRFATRLGLDGYPGLASLCRLRLRDQAQTMSRFERLQSLADAETMGLEQVAALDQSNLLRTFANVDPTAWQAAVRALSQSRRVYVAGLRKCHTVAYLLGYLLGLVREDVIQLNLGLGGFPDVLRDLGPADALVGISIHRYTLDTVRAQAFAHRRGATTIALTDNPASPLAQHSSTCFYVSTASRSVLRSLTAFVSLAQALAGAVAATRGADTRSALLLEEEVLQEFEVYWANEPEVNARSTAAPAPPPRASDRQPPQDTE